MLLCGGVTYVAILTMKMIPDTTLEDGEIRVTGMKVLTEKHKKGGRGYYHEIECSTACGETHPTTVSADKVKDLPRAVESFQEYVAGNGVCISNGFVCTRSQMGH